MASCGAAEAAQALRSSAACREDLSVPSVSVVFMKRAYTALCNTTDRDQDLDTALRWAFGQVQEDQSVTLWCWDKENLPAEVMEAAPSLGIRIRSETPHTRPGRFVRTPDGPLVAVDLPPETLVEIEPFGYPACLVHAYVQARHTSRQSAKLLPVRQIPRSGARIVGVLGSPN